MISPHTIVWMNVCVTIPDIIHSDCLNYLYEEGKCPGGGGATPVQNARMCVLGV